MGEKKGRLRDRKVPLGGDVVADPPRSSGS